MSLVMPCISLLHRSGVPCPSSHTSGRGLAAQIVLCTCARVCGRRPRVRVAVRGSSCSFLACAGGLACLSRSRPSWFPLWEYIPRCFRYRRVSLCHTCTKTLAPSLKNHRYPRTRYPQGSPSAETPPNGPSHRHITTLCNCFVTACSTATTGDFTPVHIWSNVLGHTQGRTHNWNQGAGATPWRLQSRPETAARAH